MIGFKMLAKFYDKSGEKKIFNRMRNFLKITCCDSRISVWGRVVQISNRNTSKIKFLKFVRFLRICLQLSVHIRKYFDFCRDFKKEFLIETDLANIYIYQKERLDHIFRNYSNDTKLHNPICCFFVVTIENL